MTEDICIIIPVYENARTVRDVAERALKQCRTVFVVDDGSHDNPAGQLEGLPVTLLRHSRNKGKGKALKTGFKAARAAGFKKAITLDGDGQHFPEDVASFIEVAGEHPDAMLIGSRNLRMENMPGGNTFANKFSNFWFRLQTGVSLPDTQSGFRLYQLDRLGSRSRTGDVGSPVLEKRGDDPCRDTGVVSARRREGHPLQALPRLPEDLHPQHRPVHPGRPLRLPFQAARKALGVPEDHLRDCFTPTEHQDGIPIEGECKFISRKHRAEELEVFYAGEFRRPPKPEAQDLRGHPDLNGSRSDRPSGEMGTVDDAPRKGPHGGFEAFRSPTAGNKFEERSRQCHIHLDKKRPGSRLWLNLTFEKVITVRPWLSSSSTLPTLLSGPKWSLILLNIRFKSRVRGTRSAT